MYVQQFKNASKKCPKRKRFQIPGTPSVLLGNFTPKTSNYCLKNRALGFPGSDESYATMIKTSNITWQLPNRVDWCTRHLKMSRVSFSLKTFGKFFLPATISFSMLYSFIYDQDFPIYIYNHIDYLMYNIYNIYIYIMYSYIYITMTTNLSLNPLSFPPFSPIDVPFSRLSSPLPAHSPPENKNTTRDSLTEKCPGKKKGSFW